jgi:hypothetical protein
MFIDFGNNATVEIAKLIDLESVKPDLGKIPPQVNPRCSFALIKLKNNCIGYIVPFAPLGAEH